MKKIVLVGAGRVATHLGRALRLVNLSPVAVWSRTEKSAHQLGLELMCFWTNSLVDLPVDADLYVLAVVDDAIRPVAEQLAQHIPTNRLVVHTSGATSSQVFSDLFERYGVFYPLQSFSLDRPIAFQSIPFCLSAHRASDLSLLKHIAQQLSEQVVEINDQQRAGLHVAAVFANNFTNYLQFISSQLLAQHGLPADLLQPLVEETIAKLQTLSPEEAQTGPAIRGDETTMTKHLHQLNRYPEWQVLYRLISKGIQKDLGAK